MPALASMSVYKSFLVAKEFALALVGPSIQALTKFVLCLLVTNDFAVQFVVVQHGANVTTQCVYVRNFFTGPMFYGKI